VKQNDNKTDGIILLAEAYPHDEEQMALTLQYAESAEEALNHQFKFKRFLMQKPRRICYGRACRGFC